jgi:hypothetical protein
MSVAFIGPRKHAKKDPAYNTFEQIPEDLQKRAWNLSQRERIQTLWATRKCTAQLEHECGLPGGWPICKELGIPETCKAKINVEIYPLLASFAREGDREGEIVFSIVNEHGRVQFIAGLKWKDVESQFWLHRPGHPDFRRDGMSVARGIMGYLSIMQHFLGSVPDIRRVYVTAPPALEGALVAWARQQLGQE